MPAVRKPQRQAPGLVEHLAEQARTKPVNSALGISKYYVSAQLLLRQADSYRREKNEEQQYVMLMRFASLVLETIPSHKDFVRGDTQYQQLKKALVDRYFPELETLKLSLRAKEIVDPHARSRNRPGDAVMMASSNLPTINWGAAPPPPPVPQPSSAYNPADVRVDDLLEIIQHGPGPGSAPPPMPPSQPPSAPLPLPGPPVYQPKYASSSNRHALFGSTDSGVSSSAAYGAPAASNGAIMAATRSNSGGFGVGGGTTGVLPRYPGLEAFQQLAIQQALGPTAGPALGPQEIGVTLQAPDAPGLPDTCGHVSGHALPPPPPPEPTTLPQPPEPSAPPAPPQAGGMKELVKRAALRDVHISVAVMEEFLAYARSNTARGIESCGILGGRLSANDSIFTITSLIIPKQHGTSDTVQALNEEEIFEVQFSQELYPLGWIHTHPTQTCFMSSVDVHTQCGYQTMLDEAVAIVMAPTDRSKRCGIFRLSTPGGLQLVQKCTMRGFHQHPATPTGQELYELCGHVYLNPRAKHTVIDLR